MKKSTLSIAILILSIQVSFAQGFDILVFSKTAGYRHSDAINAGNTMFSNVADSNGWNVDFTENSADFTTENLKQYEAIIWNNVSGNILNPSEKAAFKSYINAGGGYVGIHNAANAEINWPWYVGLLGGATFLNHATGNNQIQTVSIDVESPTDSITSHFEPTFTRTDEWYNFRSNPRPFVDLLLSIDESTLAGPNMRGDHPITWKHEYDGGRGVYTGFGHTVESFSEPDVITMLTEAVKWVAKDNSIILNEFNGITEPGEWVIQAPYNANNGTFQFKTTKNEIEITGRNGPNQQLVREGITIDPSVPYTVETKFKILDYGGVKSFAINFLQANQPASQKLNAWSLNLDLYGPIIKYMGFENGNFAAIGNRLAPWAVQNQEYIYKIEVNRRLNGEISPKWVTATISKPDGTIMDNFEVDYSRFRWQPNLNEPAKFGLNSHYASWTASDLKIYYSDLIPSVLEEPTSVTGMTLSPDTVSLKIGDMSTLTATVSPANASNKNVIWTSDDPSVAYVNTSGVLTGVATGTANIKVASVDGGFFDTTSVLVSTTTPETPSMDPGISLNSISYQLATLKISSWDKINDATTRKAADTHLAQAEYYFRVAAANFNNNKKASGNYYKKIFISLIKKFISNLETGVDKNKLSEAVSLSLSNEANSIIANLNFLINGQQPTPTPTPTPTPEPEPENPPVDANITLVSVSYQIDTLKIASWSKIGDYAVRSTANARLTQAKGYFNIATSNLNRGSKIGGINYLKISISQIKKYISTIENGINKGKLSEAVALPLLNEAKSIIVNTNFLIDFQQQNL